VPLPLLFAGLAADTTHHLFFPILFSHQESFFVFSLFSIFLSMLVLLYPQASWGRMFDQILNISGVDWWWSKNMYEYADFVQIWNAFTK
jgi:hypothetical protein